jgi:nicotinamidase-related amidase
MPRTARRGGPAARSATGIAAKGDAHESALLIVDMISRWDFPDAAPLLRQTAPIAPCIAALKKRCTAAGVPVIYANDNRGHWRSDFRHVVQAALEQAGPGAQIAHLRDPSAEDYFVLKPKHSAFFATPLQLLLEVLGTRRLILAGVSSDQCVLQTAADARMRNFEVVVPRDCIATQSKARQQRALTHFQDVLAIRTPSGRSIRLERSASH